MPSSTQLETRLYRLRANGRAVLRSSGSRLLAVITGLAIGASAWATEPFELAERESLTVVVADSGLGGLTVAADIARRAVSDRTHAAMNIVFYNALFDAETGYNSLPTRAERVRIFNNALEDMGQRFEPDVILVACNTLSVLLPDCAYAQEGAVPVLGIVETGSLLFEETLAEHPDAIVLLFGTPVTVEDESYLESWVEKGGDPERFVAQACPGLTEFIERDFEGFETEMMISSFVADAVASLDKPPGTGVFASLNCTHYAYAAPIWETEIEAEGLEFLGLLNPNDRMADFLFEPRLHGRAETPEVGVRFVTMVPISAEAVDSISRAIHPVSPLAAEALKNYELIPDLFPWD